MARVSSNLEQSVGSGVVLRSESSGHLNLWRKREGGMEGGGTYSGRRVVGSSRPRGALRPAGTRSSRRSSSCTVGATGAGRSTCASSSAVV